MDTSESAALDALANLLTELSENPYDIALHAQHIRLSQASEDLISQVQSAREMFTNYLAAGDEVWIPLLEYKEQSVDLGTLKGVEELLDLYARAERDYLSIPILQRHLEFLLSRHAHFFSVESKPEDLGDIFSTEWTRPAISKVVAQGAGHLTQSHLLWDAMRDWELEILEATPSGERESLVNHIQRMHLTRLRQPHSNLEETFQSYSTFTTNYKRPEEYESLLIAASKIRSQALKSYERRETSESSLAKSSFSLDGYAQYLAAERRARNPDIFVMGAVYERAIAEAAKRRFDGDTNTEGSLRMFWTGYVDALRINGGQEPEVLQRAVRSVPGSGEVWARYIRYLERITSDEEIEGPEDISEIFSKALAPNLIQKDMEQIVPIFIARAGYVKRRIEAGKGNDNAFATLIKVLEDGIVLVRQVSPMGDPRLRLEKYLTEIYLRLADLPENAITVWQTTAAQYKSSYLAWVSYTDVLIKQDAHAQARTVFSDVCMKNIDWPEAIWEAWISFEHLYGSVEELETCLDKVERAQLQVNARRAKEAQQAAYQAMQIEAEKEASSVPVVEAMQTAVEAGAPMEVDMPHAPEGGTKRKAEDEQPAGGSKKARMEQKPVVLKRDRENCTVFVANLPTGITENELKDLFKDCGKVRETKITELPNALVSTVEFFERDSVPAALTKDKKRLRGEDVAVHLAWKSTLYVTNFPESADDSFMRKLFGTYGTIFDIRWPSKKFKSTRRFCYVQFTSPSSADKALELHGRELEPQLSMSVYISNPERKKERTDADANEREIYVAGLNKFTTKGDLEALFRTYGSIKEVRMILDDEGNSKGFAFIDYEQEHDARAALSANNLELKKRRIAVTLVDPRVRSRNRNAISESGLSQKSETKSRSVRVRGLPAATQEGLLQQFFQRHAQVKRVEVFADKNEAVIELENAAEAGKLLLRTDPLIFNGTTLALSEEGDIGAMSGPPPRTGGMFVPRSTGSRPRAGLGRSKQRGKGSTAAPPFPGHSSAVAGPSQPVQGKGQDDFRKMLGRT